MNSDKLLEQLFLLEVVIDKLALRNKCDHSPKCTCNWPPYDESMPLRIRIKFINFPCFEIEQEYFSKEIDNVKGLTIVENFSSGKSCLFPMAPLDLVRAMQLYPLAVTVYQRKFETSPAKVIGAARVPLSQEMIEAVRKVTYCEEELPINTNLLGNFPLTGPGGKDAGRVHVFVRLSCFGQSIVTQFQLVDEFQSFLFKNSRADTASTCKRCTGRINVPCAPYKDVLPMKALLCEEDGTKVEEVRDTAFALCPFNPKALAKLCECDVHREGKSSGDVCPLALDPYCRGCNVNFPAELGPCEIFVAEDVRAADITAARFQVEKPSATTLVVTQTCKECCDEALKNAAIKVCCKERSPQKQEAQRNQMVRGVVRGAVRGVDEEVRGEKPTEGGENGEKAEKDPLEPPQWFMFGQELYYYEPPIERNPPVRYDTTSSISGAWDVFIAPLPHPPIRYDTTSSLTTAFQDLPVYKMPPHPLVRYDNTSILSPAFNGALPPVSEMVRNPPVRYDNTGCLSSAFNHPPCRYDTTGKLSSYYISEEPPDFIHLLPLIPQTKSPKSIHLLEYKPLMSYDVGPDWTLLELHQLLKKPVRGKTCKKSPIKKPPQICPPKITQFPAVRRGHKRCLDVQFRVPSRMGWLWNTSACGLPYRPGWRPGAMSRAVSMKIHEFHKAYGLDAVQASKKRHQKTGDDGQHELPPTLVLTRRRGKFHLSVRPLPEGEKPLLEQYAPAAARPAEARPYSVDLTVSKSSSMLSGSASSLRAQGAFSESSSGFSSTGDARSSYSSSSSSVCPPCECGASDDTDSLKIEFVAPANFYPRWKFPTMHHEETLVTAEELAAARRKIKRKKKVEAPPPPAKEKGKKGKGKGAKGKKVKK